MKLFVQEHGNTSGTEDLKRVQQFEMVFLGVSYDFKQKKWQNDLDKSEFNSSLWAEET